MSEVRETGEPRPRQVRIVLFCILLLAFALRIINLEVTGLWMDEIHSAIGAAPDKTLSEVLEYCKSDQPPLFFIILHQWYKVFGYSDSAGRQLVVWMGVAGVFAMFFIAREFSKGNVTVGLFASFLTAINYFHVDFSRQVRFYPLVFLLSALSYYFFLKVFTSRRPIAFILYGIATSALLNTHYFGMVVFVSQFILFVFIIIKIRLFELKFIIPAVITGVVTALTFAHWLPVIFADLQIPSFHAAPLKWYFPFEYFYIYFRDYATTIISGILMVLAIRHILVVRRKQKHVDIQDIILLGWIFLGFLLPVTYSLVRMPMLEYKYTFIVVPAFLILIACGLDEIGAVKYKYWLTAVLFGLFISNATLGKSIYFRLPFEQWREVAQTIVKDETDQAVFSSYAWYYRYYFKIFHAANQPLEPQYADVPAHLATAKRVWVISSKRFPDNGLTEEQNALLLNSFMATTTLEFVDAVAIRYERRSDK